MNEDPTRELPDNRSFEERVFARFDRIDARLERVEARLDGLDIRVHALEARALDTKPIWERALVEILEVKKGVDDINRKLDVLNHDVLQVRADQRLVHKRMDALESGLQ
jgi:tetrahydromethanopterin S-methyltransferase subunit G